MAVFLSNYVFPTRYSLGEFLLLAYAVSEFVMSKAVATLSLLFLNL